MASALIIVSKPARLLTRSMPYTPYAWFALAVATVVMGSSLVMAFYVDGWNERATWLVAAIAAAPTAARLLQPKDLRRRKQDMADLATRREEAQNLLLKYGDVQSMRFITALVSSQLAGAWVEALKAL